MDEDATRPPRKRAPGVGQRPALERLPDDREANVRIAQRPGQSAVGQEDEVVTARVLVIEELQERRSTRDGLVGNSYPEVSANALLLEEPPFLGPLRGDRRRNHDDNRL